MDKLVAGRLDDATVAGVAVGTNALIGGTRCIYASKYERGVWNMRRRRSVAGVAQ